jgi:hypothetical protein
MNAREGMRRLGLVLGVLGCVVGGVFGYLDLQNVWSSHTKFERLQSLAMKHDVAATIKAYQDSGNVGFVPLHETPPPPSGFVIEKTPLGRTPQSPPADSSDWVTTRQPRESTWFDQADDPAAKITIDLNGEEDIQSVNADKTGTISSFKLTTGELVHKPPGTLKAHLAFIGRLFLSFCWPVGGFLIPWGIIRICVWVGSGFFA